MTVLATDNFNRADANPIGAPWTTFGGGHGAMRIVSNAAEPADLTNDCAAYHSTVPPADQYVQAKLTVNSLAGDVGIGLMLRAATGAATCYRLVLSHSTTNNVALSSFVAGTFAVIWARTATFADGDLVRFEAVGTTLRAYINGVQVGADTTDSSISSGRFGLYYSSQATSGSIDDWEGGDFLAPEIGIPQGVLRKVPRAPRIRR